MILTGNDFPSIEAAVRQGRGVPDNLVKFIVWTLPANLGFGLLLVTAIIVGGQLPILPAQVAVAAHERLVLGLPFAVEPVETDIMKRRPRDPAAPLLSRALTARVALVSVMLFAGGFGLFRWETSDGGSAVVAYTMVVNVFALTLLTYLFNCLSLQYPILWGGVRRNPWVAVGGVTLLGLQALHTYAPFMNDLFQSAPLNITAWLRICAVAVISYTVVELIKGTHRLRSSRRSVPASPAAIGV